MKLLCIDGNSILNRAFYGIRELSTKDGTPTNAIYGFFNILSKMISEVSPDGIVVAFDMHAPTFRHKMYDGYKAKRKGMPEELFVQMPIAKELIELLGYYVCEKEGYEADDILGAFSNSCKQSGNECIIATGDRDSLQLVNDSVTVRLATTKETIIYTPEKIFEVYGITPRQLIDLKALMGDTSDNIPGVTGCGEKTALGLIQKFSSLDGVYENIDDPFIKPKMREKIINDKEQAYMSRELAEIVFDVPIDLDPTHYTSKPMQNEKVAQKFTELEMVSMLKKFSLESVIPEAPIVAKKEIICNYTVTQNPPISTVADRLSTQQAINFICEFNGVELAVLHIACENEIFTYNFNSINAFEELIVNSNKPKHTTNSKQIYHFAIQNKFDITNIVMDIELAGYLLNSAGDDYSIKALANEFIDEFKTDCEQFDIAVLPYLSEKLTNELEHQNMKELLCDIEIPFCEVLANMEETGVYIDKNGVNEFGKLLQERIKELTSEIYDLADEEFNINSTQHLARILFEKLGLPAKKKTKSGYSTNAQVLEELYDRHPIIPRILEYRKLTKLNSTYVVGLIKEIKDDGRIHSVFKQTEARTGRISSTEPNMQNIPVRTKLGSQMRKFFVAKDGYTLVDADYSQIELRILAHIANDKQMIDAFKNGLDIHSMTASKVFNIPIDELPPEIRSRAKAINFGIVYGIGAFSLSKDIGTSVSEASKYIKDYLSTYSGVKDYMDKTIADGTKNGYVTTMFNRRRALPELSSKNKNIVAFGERVAMNAPIQGSAADIIKIAMVKVFKRLKAEKLDAKIILQVHDEIILEASEKDADKSLTVLCEEMQSAASLNVPLVADGKIAKSWYLAKE